MRLLVDALMLPLADNSVDAVISNPPYPGNGVWEGNWWGQAGRVVDECRRALKPHGRGWFLVRNPQGGEQWFTFNREFCRWAHEGGTRFGPRREGITNWGHVPDADVEVLIRQWCPPGGIVLDPFAGRGGIPKLAESLGRVGVGADIDVAQLESGGSYAVQER